MSLSNSEINEIRNQFEKEIKELDLQIQFLETSFLEETKESGNVIRGFQNYLASKLARGAIPYKRVKIQPQQRLFSLSSTTSRANQMIDYSINETKGQTINSINQNLQARNNQRMKRQKNVKDYVKLQKGDKQSSEKNQNDSKSSSQSEGGRKRKKFKKGMPKIIKKI